MQSSLKNLFFFLILLVSVACESDKTPSSNSSTETTTMTQPTDANLWIGTYTRKEGHVDGRAAGIYGLRLNGKSAKTSFTADDIVNPSFVAQSPDGKFLYAVSEIGPDIDTTGYVYCYRVNGEELVYVNRQPTYSFAPCNLVVGKASKWLYASNYVGGTLVRYPLAQDGSIKSATGRLRLKGSGPTDRQEDSHPHSVSLSPDGKWILVADLGTDKIHSYRAATPKWEEVTYVESPPGAGPRHLAFHPTADYAYVVNELNSSVTAFHFNEKNGALNTIAHYPTLPANTDTFNLCADIHITPDGKYLYASNRGHNSLAAFAINTATGKLTAAGYFATRGDFPRNFAIAPSGEYLLVANQNSDNIVRFDIAPSNGQLDFSQVWGVKTPVCLVFKE